MINRRLLTACLLFIAFVASPVHAEPEPAPGERTAHRTAAGHPRLYFTPDELRVLREQRTVGVHARIWKNLAESADWCLTKTPRTEWIAPLADDPIYENLYDRFYAMMMDMAITEHVAFAYALSGDQRYGDAARDWTLACCRAWKPDADAEPDGGKAYAVSRLLKGVGVAYDLAYDQFSERERAEIRSMLSRTADNYYRKYFTTPEKAGPGFHTHHAIVELSSLGVVALALLDEVPEAADWLAFTVRRFEDHLLPTGLDEDGAQVEGATFWASTMHYRLFFMDALRRVTGKDLFGPYKQYMKPDLALASVATEKQPGWNEPHQSVVFSPPYGQLDYYAPVLLALAREYRDGTCQMLALWDHSLGHIQKTRYITPNRREQLLFELGGYAYIWYDASVRSDPVNAPLSYHFPSVGQAYARGSWDPKGLLCGLKQTGEAIIHAGGTAVLIASGVMDDTNSTPHHLGLQDDGSEAALRCGDSQDARVSIELHRPHHATARWRGVGSSWSFWCLRPPEVAGGCLTWDGDAEVRVATGQVVEVQPDGYRPAHAVGNGRLALIDPMPMQFPVVRVEPEEGEVVLEIQVTTGGERRVE